MIMPIAMLPECPAAPLVEGEPIQCSLEERQTGSELIKTVIQCTRCGWLDIATLDRWVEQALKSRMDKASQAVAMAASGEPFTFVQFPDEPLTVKSALAQAMGAASMCWVGGPGDLEFDSERAARIYNQIWAVMMELRDGKIQLQ